MASLDLQTCQAGNDHESWSVKFDTEADPQYEKLAACAGAVEIGDLGAGTEGAQMIRRAALSFDLATLPANAEVSTLELLYNIFAAGGVNGLWSFGSYGTNAQTYPCDEAGQTCWNSIVGSHVYVAGSTNPRTTGDKTEVLGANKNAQACLDLVACKAAGKHFNLGCYMNPEQEPDCLVTWKSWILRITYTLGGGTKKRKLLCVGS